MSAPAKVTSFRLVVPAPEGGWLTNRDPESALERLPLGARWREVAGFCARVANLPLLPRVRVLLVVRQDVADKRPIRHRQDIRQTVNEVYDGLVAAQVLPSTDRSVISYEQIRIGARDPHGGQLVLRLQEVPGHV